MRSIASANVFAAGKLNILVWLFAFMIALNPTQANSQSPASQIWFTYNQQARLSTKWGYVFDVNHRITAIDKWESVISAARAGAVYIPNNHLRIAAGYAWFGQWVKSGDKQLQHENRLWQQVIWNTTRPTFSYMQRIRLEERFRHVNLPTGKEASAYTTRLRYMAQFQGMLIKPKKPDGFALKWQAAEEIMLHAGEYVNEHYFEQNRLIGGIVLAPSPNIELAVLYQYIIQYLPIPERMQQIHSLRLTLQHSIDFRD